MDNRVVFQIEDYVSIRLSSKLEPHVLDKIGLHLRPSRILQREGL